jgi:alpha-tubulin suppressor-like RCC1 family protein
MTSSQILACILAACLTSSGCKESASPTDTGPLRFVQISAGFWHTCALTAAGKAYCWGYSRYGELGASLNNRTRGTPIAVAGNHLFKNISAGWLYTCGVLLDESAYCWGASGSGAAGPIPVGQTCDGTPCVLKPWRVAAPNQFLDVSTGYPFTCGRLTNQRIMCWGIGEATFGSLGDTAFVSLSRSYPGCGLTADSLAYCWGANQRGRVGDSSLTARPFPVAVSGGLKFIQIAASAQHSCGIVTGGALYCWGFNDAGQFGQGFNDEAVHPVPEAAAGGLLFSVIDLNIYDTCGITASQVAYCWGSNGSGIVGDGTLDQRLAPTLVLGSLKFVSISVGFSHACGIATDSLAYCWGSGGEGELGVDPLTLGPPGTSLSSTVPILVSRQVP